MRVLLLSLFLLFISLSLIAQEKIQGSVSDQDGFPLSDIRIYIANSSKEVFTNADGNFTLPFYPPSQVLVVESTEYENQSIQVNSADKKLSIVMRRSAVALEEVLVQPDWDKWENQFIEFRKHFIGRGEKAKKVKIKNAKKVLRFREENGVMQAIARRKLIIDNPFLGYDIEYELVEFSLNYKLGRTLSVGKSFFREKEGSKSKQKRWKNRRLEAYNGSIKHFITTVYNNQLKNTKFEVRRAYSIENPNRPSAEEIERAKSYIRRQSRINLDLSSPEAEILLRSRLPKKLTVLVDSLLYEDYFLKKTASGKRFMDFPDSLQIRYTAEKTPTEYGKYFLFSGNYDQQETMVFIEGNSAIEIFKRGNYYPPHRLLVDGYWGWEKMVYFLPLDYEP